MQKNVIIVAGGQGNRFESELPKQFIQLAGQPILMHSIESFYQYDNGIKIIVVLPSDQIDFWKELCTEYKFEVKHQLVLGGSARFYSVRNGLSCIEEDGLVAIHDGVRPLVDSATIHRCFEKAESGGNAIPVVNLIDSMRKLEENGSNFHVDRADYRLVQTPQVFQNKLILKAFEQDYKETFTDDASVLEAILPNSINLVEGNRKNIKITTREDLLYAEVLIGGAK